MRTALRALITTWLLLAACASAPVAVSSPASPPATPTPRALETPRVSTVSPTASPTQVVLETPRASATPAVSETPTAISASPSATPAVDPLTGLAVDSPASLQRRPLMIKIAQFPRRVRPQFGLSLADNVWEHYAEGGVTRLTAIFLSQGADKLGNVRSARLIDAILGEAYRAMFVAAGSSDGVLDRLRHSNFFNRFVAEETGYRTCPILCREAPGPVTTDKLFTSAPALWDLATRLGLNGAQDLSGFTFDPRPPTGGADAPTVHLDFQLDNNVVEWRYDPAAQAYARWVDGNNMPELAAQTDAITSRQLTAENVVVVYVPYSVTNLIENEAGRLLSYDILLTGSGPAKLFRDGKLYAAQWKRGSTGLPRLLDAAGSPVPFRPGHIWFELVTPDSPTQFDAGLFKLRFKAPDAHATPVPTP